MFTHLFHYSTKHLSLAIILAMIGTTE